MAPKTSFRELKPYLVINESSEYMWIRFGLFEDGTIESLEAAECDQEYYHQTGEWENFVPSSMCVTFPTFDIESEEQCCLVYDFSEDKLLRFPYSHLIASASSVEIYSPEEGGYVEYDDRSAIQAYRITEEHFTHFAEPEFKKDRAIAVSETLQREIVSNAAVGVNADAALYTLPEEVVAHIFSFLPFIDASIASSACKLFFLAYLGLGPSFYEVDYEHIIKEKSLAFKEPAEFVMLIDDNIALFRNNFSKEFSLVGLKNFETLNTVAFDFVDILRSQLTGILSDRFIDRNRVYHIYIFQNPYLIVDSRTPSKTFYFCNIYNDNIFTRVPTRVQGQPRLFKVSNHVLTILNKQCFQKINLLAINAEVLLSKLDIPPVLGNIGIHTRTSCLPQDKREFLQGLLIQHDDLYYVGYCEYPNSPFNAQVYNLTSDRYLFTAGLYDVMGVDPRNNLVGKFVNHFLISGGRIVTICRNMAFLWSLLDGTIERIFSPDDFGIDGREEFVSAARLGLNLICISATNIGGVILFNTETLVSSAVFHPDLDGEFNIERTTVRNIIKIKEKNAFFDLKSARLSKGFSSPNMQRNSLIDKLTTTKTVLISENRAAIFTCVRSSPREFTLRSASMEVYIFDRRKFRGNHAAGFIGSSVLCEHDASGSDDSSSGSVQAGVATL